MEGGMCVPRRDEDILFITAGLHKAESSRVADKNALFDQSLFFQAF